MWSHERQAKILEKLTLDSKVSTVELAETFGISRETARRDLMEMEQSGHLRRVHGGAVPAITGIDPEPPFSLRLEQFAEQKDAIGRAACDLVPQGSTCFIDAGTTTIAFARHLAARGNIRVITNSIEIAQIIAGGRDTETLLLGGRPHTDVPATYGELTLSEIDRFHGDFAVISPVGLHLARGASDYELHEAEIARAMMRRSKECVMLCHSSKIGIESRVGICRIDEIDHRVVDRSGEAISIPRGTLHLAD